MILIAILAMFIIPYIYIMVKGPTTWDRLLCMSLISTKVTLIAVLYAVITDRSFMIDYAFIYVLLGFISMFFITVYWVKHRSRKRS